MTSKHFKKQGLALMTIIGFLVLTVFPNILMFTDLEEKSRFTKADKFPEINVKAPLKTVSSLKSYYLENYGLKSTLVNTYIDFKKNILDENPIPNRALSGKDGWYFLGNYHNYILDNNFGLRTYSDIDLYRMKQNLLDLNTYFKSIDVDFYFVIVPNKSTIYSEKLPYALTHKETALSQFLSKIQSEDNLDIIDLRYTLTKNKDSTRLYHKTDTHWNHRGAYLGYNSVIKTIEKKNNTVTPASLNYFSAIDKQLEGDITRMINTVEKEKITRYERNQNSSVEILVATNDIIKIRNEKKDLKLLMYRDSFANYWIDYFNESFNEASYYKYKNGIKKSDILKEQPDVFVLEVGERHFDILLKSLKLID